MTSLAPPSDLPPAFATAARMDAASSLLLVIDVQEKLCPVMDDPRRVLMNGARLVRGARRLGVPVLVTEQYTRGLGPTMTDIRDALADPERERASEEGAAAAAQTPTVLEKTAFCGVADDAIRAALLESGRCQAVLCGIEMHVCVLQTALGLRSMGWQVFVVTDACSSRQPDSERAALARLSTAGVVPVTTEMVLFEWLHAKENPAFRDIMALIR